MMTDTILSRIEISFSKLDLFCLPYQNFLSSDRQKQRKTFVGGFLSLLIILISMSYFIYLCYLYFANQVQPTISQIQYKHGQQYALEIPQDFLIIKIKLSNQQNLVDYEKQHRNKLISLNVQYNYTDEFDQFKSQVFFMIPCLDEKLYGYYCIDYQNAFKKDQKIPLKFISQDKSDNILFTISECNEKYLQPGSQCEQDSTIINKLVFDVQNDIRVYIKLQQYNTFTKEVEDKIKYERIILDNKLVMMNQIEIKKNDLEIIDGFIIQSSRQQTIMDDYKRLAVSVNQEYIKESFHVLTYATLFFFPEQYITYQTIQYSPFTSLFAQFLSVFNALLILGFFFKKFSEAQIFEDLLQTLLITQYKQTAVDLIKKNIKIDKQGSFDLYQYITSIEYKQKFHSIIGIGFFRRILLFSGKASSKRNQKEDNQKLQILHQLIEFTNKQNNIFDLLQRVMQMETMTRLLFTPQQYAAIKLCGMRVFIDKDDDKTKYKKMEINKQIELPQSNHKINNSKELSQLNKEIQISDTKTFINDKQNSQYNTKNEIQRGTEINIEKDNQQIEQKEMKNHLEIIQQIEQDQIQFKELVSKFIEQVQSNQQQTSELDKRIFQSMISITEQNQNGK